MYQASNIWCLNCSLCVGPACPCTHVTMLRAHSLSVLFCSRWGFGLNLDVQVSGEHARLPTYPRAGQEAYNKDKDPLFPIADQVETQCHCISSWHMPGGRAEFQIIFLHSCMQPSLGILQDSFPRDRPSFLPTGRL